MTESRSKPIIDPIDQQEAIDLAKEFSIDPEILGEREAFIVRWKGQPRKKILKMIQQYKRNIRRDLKFAGKTEGEGDSDAWRIAALESLL